MNTEKSILKKVYTAKTKEELMEAYNEWAREYDGDLEEFGYQAPVESVNTFLKYVDSDAKVIDVGCGTGLVGSLLCKNGFCGIHGLDYSKDMLEVAGEKDIYDNLFHADLTMPLDLKEKAYDALICVGTFTYGHVESDAFERILSLVKPGGHIVFTVREGAYDDLNYREKMVEMEAKKLWELKEMTDAVYFSGENVSCKLCTYEVL
ncbi:class I SAM-dependent DNA methyltransferase [Limisalsivibrio acetivorans]|uniref:class I SAM-dependent DNA methyltransferase n=1 Tax=Limisalsivibrio acetivorans TaxID=1304888 RepID=UPI0003B4B3B2|nr:class I SAM-dependent methyltransferase [Limisalsivibrio acetivorans]